MVRLTLDSWDVDYGASAALADETWDDVAAAVDLEVETASYPDVSWERQEPVEPAARIPRMAFVDGVRRLEARLRADDGEVSAAAIAGSWAVGVIHTGRPPELGRIDVGRTLVVGAGLPAPTLMVSVGESTLAFEGHSLPDADPEAPAQALQASMRGAEATLARRLLAEGDGDELLVIDGPLAYVTNEPVLGLIKQQRRMYLPPERERGLAAMPLGARTPIFHITYGAEYADPGRRRRRWSWYLRIASRRPVDSHLVGIVRLETPDATPLEQARAVADRASACLPLLASDPLRDPRAPQNLYPVGELERQLHRRLGMSDLVRRRVRQHLERAAEAGTLVPAQATA